MENRSQKSSACQLEMDAAPSVRRGGLGHAKMGGASLFGVARTEVDALITLLPRVTSPALIEAEVLRMDAADLMQCGLALASFCMPKAVLANAETQVG